MVNLLTRRRTAMTAAKSAAARRSGTRKSRVTYWYVDLMIHLALILCCLIILYPFLWILSVALNGDAATTIPRPFGLIPAHVSLGSLKQTWGSLDIPRLYLNTLIVALGSVAISLGTAVLSGYAISKLRFRGARVVLVLALATMMIPPEGTIIPLFLLFNRLGLINSYGALYLLQLIYSVGTFLSKQYFDSTPSEYRESAAIDGAGEFRIFFSVYLPLAGPLIGVLGIIEFLSVWNSLLWPVLVLNDPDKYTLQVAVSVFISSQRSELTPGPLAACAIYMILPVLVVYFFFQRKIVASVAHVGVRG